MASARAFSSGDRGLSGDTWGGIVGVFVWTFYNEILPEFQKLGAELLGISVDGVWCHAAFARDRKLHFPLLADFEPKGDVARRYGVYRDKDGVSERALFVIDTDGKVHWSFVSPIGVNPGADGILSALEDLQNKQAAPVTTDAK